MTSHLTSNSLLLRIFVEDNELRDYYCRKITEHIQHVSTDPTPDSGFDLCVPNQIVVASGGKSTKVDLKVKCVMLEMANLLVFTHIQDHLFPKHL